MVATWPREFSCARFAPLRCPLLVSLLILSLGGDSAAAFVQAVRPSSAHQRELVVEAKIVCGVFDGKFECRNVSGAGTQFGKSATPGAKMEPDDGSPDSLPGGAAPGTDAGQALQDGTTCQNGMVGTPPNCRCPENSELLGGNCVHYTASACSKGLASDALPQACQGVEEKLSCTMRQDGMKDCCCLTYDKF